MVQKISLLVNTARYLKPVQVWYQLKYRLKKPGKLSEYDKNFSADKIQFFEFQSLPPVPRQFLGDNKFLFLNIREEFSTQINWNFQKHGKLWNYNLQYCNFLLQENLLLTEKEKLVLSLYNWLDQGHLPLEPYPSSLRIINIIRLYSNENKKSDEIFAFLHAELDFLSSRLEFHLLGNHLLENGFALIMGGAFFSKKNWYNKGKEIIKSELKEQILKDGGHFELSPMYHQIIFFRLLELIDWYSYYNGIDQSFEDLLNNKAATMYSWLAQMGFKNGEVPLFNDSANGIAYSTKFLLNYAKKLGIKDLNKPLGSSGYRAYNFGEYEVRIDAAHVGSDYQPGHAHADALSFILHYKNDPLFVEQGTSTYNICERRSSERGTAAHNTVVVDGQDQSQVWSGFRVAKRAKTKIIRDKPNELVAEHNGYRKLGITHRRSYHFGQNTISIKDNVEGNPDATKEFHLHIAPEIDLTHTEEILKISGLGEVKFNGATKIQMEDYKLALGFNKYENAKKIIVSFDTELSTLITFKN